MDSMIKVEDVSMKFNLGIEKNFSLKLFFINMFKPKKKDEKKGNKDFWALKHVNFEVGSLTVEYQKNTLQAL